MGFINKFKLFILIFTLLISGCFTGKNLQKTFVRKNVDISYIKKVAVLPFENHTRNENVGEIIRDIVTTEILASNIFDVESKTFVNSVISDETGAEPTEEFNYNKETLKRIARKLKVNGLIIGSIDQYSTEREGSYSYPVITITLKLIDGKTGIILWQTSGTKNGYSTFGKLFGFKSKDINELCFNLIENLLKTLK